MNSRSFIKALIRIGGGIWIAAIIIFIGLVAYAAHETIPKESFRTPLLITVSIGIASFLVASYAQLLRVLLENPSRSLGKAIIVAPIAFALFPLYYSVHLFLKKSPHQTKTNSWRINLTKVFRSGFIFSLLLPLWLGGFLLAITIAKDRLNIAYDPISISGTGSMYPTFPKGRGDTHRERAEEIVSTPGMRRYPGGFTILGREMMRHEIGRGDIVTFFNEQTKNISYAENSEASSFVKRVVALPGDTVELKRGILHLNRTPQKEPYVAVPQSTFGGKFLPECRELKVPEGKVFVLGDNRKGSNDSRHDVGFVAMADISHVLPWSDQKGVVDALWHDASGDLENSAKIMLNSNEFLQLLNEKRLEKSLKPLKLDQKLIKSAENRAEAMFRYNDVSFEASKSGYTMQKAMSEAGYTNTKWGEIPTQGYYNARELIENLFAFPDSQAFLLDPEFSDFGIIALEGNLNGCPTQLIVEHFGGYVPPNYSQEYVDSWEGALANLRSIRSGWANLKNYPEFYHPHRQDIDRINEIISTRIKTLELIVYKLKANQWLSEADQAALTLDGRLAEEQEILASKLNNL